MSSSLIYGCSIWFIAAAPVIFFTLLAVFIGGLTAAPLGAIVGVILGVISYRYGMRVLRAARAYERRQAQRRSSPPRNEVC